MKLLFKCLFSSFKGEWYLLFNPPLYFLNAQCFISLLAKIKALLTLFPFRLCYFLCKLHVYINGLYILVEWERMRHRYFGWPQILGRKIKWDWSKSDEIGECHFRYSGSPLSVVSFSKFSVTGPEPQSKVVKWKIPAVNIHKFTAVCP